MTQPAPGLPQAEAMRRDDATTSIEPEPATARALWPTFMRRTLAEDTLRQDAFRQAAE